ncbi:hypothetical protein Salat_2657600 [Sesamum alatum]|uniref:Retrotransposon gag domain-containing protein n=1 Tax=Sesamum alatum TaxID=300844 RepID=A0AAE2CB00_9LAMI|nr:hypothetical protein Salat_2657600 [Sesamum alatum]
MDCQTLFIVVLFIPCVGRAQEWFGSLTPAIVVSYYQLARKFLYHFVSKEKMKKSAMHHFTIRQKDDEILRSFVDRFNTEVLDVHDLRVDMMTSILIHGLKKGPVASALARDPPIDVEELHFIAEKYIQEEEMNILKENEWKVQPSKEDEHKK